MTEMDTRVPTLSIVFMGVSLVMSIAIPLILFLYFRKRRHCDFQPFFTGCLVFLLFALVLESSVHRLVLGSSVGGTIRENTLLYALYGGLMAGLFEETGRYLAFSTVLKKYRGNDENALMYGAGHGSFEVLILLGLSMVSNLSLAVLINAGNLDQITGPLSGDTLAQVEAAISTLTSTAPPVFLAGIVERIFAVAVHLALSVPVWFAVKKRRPLLYVLAILLHALLDGFVVILSGKISIWVLEGCVGLMALLTIVIAAAIWKKYARKQEETRAEV